MIIEMEPIGYVRNEVKQIYLKHSYVATKYNIIETENGDYLCFDVMEKSI